MIAVHTAQRGSAHKLPTSTSTFFLSIYEIVFNMLSALLDNHDFLVCELLLTALFVQFFAHLDLEINLIDLLIIEKKIQYWHKN